ncbi:hypothetical protein EII34_11220 [Arachnia propionica]|uniref:Uncharacterized protein n=1 Tax=Arachnia propionica TaxID=1750 RepID=A0A3P1T4E3_9ACTN|nr:hypothetical protein [Arachnia propionica]RRD04168.1 hypothetical protein EII34_11220 [Arachnia propionica]
MKLLRLLVAVPLLLLGACTSPPKLSEEEALQRIEQWAATSDWQAEYEVTRRDDTPPSAVVGARVSVEVPDAKAARRFFFEFTQLTEHMEHPRYLEARMSWPQDDGKVELQLDARDSDELAHQLWGWATAPFPGTSTARRIGFTDLAKVEDAARHLRRDGSRTIPIEELTHHDPVNFASADDLPEDHKLVLRTLEPDPESVSFVGPGDKHRIRSQQEAVSRLHQAGIRPQRYQEYEYWLGDVSLDEARRALDILGRAEAVHADRFTLHPASSLKESYPLLEQLLAVPGVEHVSIGGTVELTIAVEHCAEAIASIPDVTELVVECAEGGKTVVKASGHGSELKRILPTLREAQRHGMVDLRWSDFAPRGVTLNPEATEAEWEEGFRLLRTLPWAGTTRISFRIAGLPEAKLYLESTTTGEATDSSRTDDEVWDRVIAAWDASR